MRNRKLARTFVLLCAAGILSTISGCGQSLGATVHGKATVKGKPLTKGTIVFSPVAKGPLVSANVQADGTYLLGTGQNMTLPPGEYLVTASAFEGDATEPTFQNPNPKVVTLLIDEKYADKGRSGLKYTIKPGDNEINIDFDPPERP